MKELKFHFCHPIKGRIRFMRPYHKELNQTLPVDSKNSAVLKIPLEGFLKGKWKVVLEWEHEGRDFFYEKEINVS